MLEGADHCYRGKAEDQGRIKSPRAFESVVGVVAVGVL